MNSEFKILVCQPEDDVKKVLRLTPPLPLYFELGAHLLRQFDPSGLVSTSTHDIVLVDGEQREVGLLADASQLYNGRRLHLRRKESIHHVGQSTSSGLPGLPSEALVFKQARMETGKNHCHSIKTSSNLSSVHFSMETQTGEQLLKLVHSPTEVALPPPVLAPTRTQQGYSVPAARHPPSVIPLNGGSQLSLEEAIRREPNYNLMDETTCRLFNFPSCKKGSKSFAQLSECSRRMLFTVLLRILRGAGVSVKKFSNRSEISVVNFLKKEMKQLRKTSLSALKPSLLLQEAWIRGVIVAGDTDGNYRQMKNKVELRVGPEFDEAAGALIRTLTEEIVLTSVLNILSNTAVPKRDHCGFSEDGTTLVVPIPELQAELHKTGDIRSAAISHRLRIHDENGKDKEVHAVTPKTTTHLLRAVQELLWQVSHGANHTIPKLAEFMMANKDFTLDPKYLSNNVWETIIQWCISRGFLVKADDRAVVLSNWATSMKDQLTQHPTILDLRCAKDESIHRAHMLLPILQDDAHALHTSEGLPLKLLVTKCRSLPQFARDAMPTICWSLFRLAMLDFVELRANGHPLQMNEASLLDVQTTSVHASTVMKNSFLCSTPSSHFVNPFAHHRELRNVNPSHLLQTMSSVKESAKEHLLTSGIVLCHAVATQAKLGGVTRDWLSNETKWAKMLFGERKLHTTSASEAQSLFFFIQECGLVTWIPETEVFVVRNGLFDSMYYTFLLRLDVAIRAGKSFRNQPGPKKGRPKKIKTILPTMREAMNSVPDLGIQNAKFEILSFRCFLERARLDNIVMYQENDKDQIKQIKFDHAALQSALESLKSDSSVLSYVAASKATEFVDWLGALTGSQQLQLPVHSKLEVQLCPHFAQGGIKEDRFRVHSDENADECVDESSTSDDESCDGSSAHDDEDDGIFVL